MKVYITYDWYSYEEWFNIYQVTTDINVVKRDYKENLKTFISSGPDDDHHYQIQEVNLGQKGFGLLADLYIKPGDPFFVDKDREDIYWLMTKIYEEADGNNCLLQTDGASDNANITTWWLEQQGLDPNDDDVYWSAEEDLFGNEDLYSEVLDKYIDATYPL